MKLIKSLMLIATLCFFVTVSYEVLAADNGDKTARNKQANASQNNKRPKLEPKIRDALKEMLSTSHEGLKEENAKSGKKINLQGRFKHAPVAVIDEDGKVVITEYSSIPEQE